MIGAAALPSLMRLASRAASRAIRRASSLICWTRSSPRMAARAFPCSARTASLSLPTLKRLPDAFVNAAPCASIMAASSVSVFEYGDHPMRVTAVETVVCRW